MIVANEVAVGERTQSADPRVATAASALAQAVHRLRTIRRNALGGNYDQATFDKAVLECRQAEADVQMAREEFEAARIAAGEGDAERAAATPAGGPVWQRLVRRLAGARRQIQLGRGGFASSPHRAVHPLPRVAVPKPPVFAP
jgi:hypothetical protein